MNCIFCGKTGEIKYEKCQDSMIGGGRFWTLKHCKKDQLLWIDEAISFEGLSEIYNKYPSHIAATEGSSNKLQKIYNLFFSDNLISYFGPIKCGKILDFGCGGGSFMNKMQKIGFDVYGVEFDSQLVEKLKDKFGPKKIKKSEDILDFEEKSFDVVILNNVIEHLVDPVGILKSLKTLLKDDGKLIVLTPNINSLGHLIFGRKWRGLEVPRHRFIFSPQAMKTMLINNGFCITKINFSSRLSRGIFVSSLVPSLEMSFKKPLWRYGLHFLGFLFASLESLLKIFSFNFLSEEMIFIVNKKIKSPNNL